MVIGNDVDTDFIAGAEVRAYYRIMPEASAAMSLLPREFRFIGLF
jgi:hypothetical protein